MAHSPECTKEPSPYLPLPNYGSMRKFGTRAQLRNVLQEKKNGGRGGSSFFFSGDSAISFFVVVGTATQVQEPRKL